MSGNRPNETGGQDSGGQASSGQDASGGAAGTPGASGQSAGGSGGSDRPALDSKAPIYLLGVGLVLALVFANVALAADGTALDSDHAVETMDDEGVYSDITTEVRDAVAEDINQRAGDRISREQSEEVAAAAVNRSYVEGEAIRNVEALYAYINGEEDDITLAINLTGPRATVVQMVEQRTFDSELAQQVGNEVPDQRNLTAGGEPPSELDSARGGASAIGTLTLVLPLLSLLLVGGIYYFSKRSIRHTGHYAGIAFAVAGVISLFIGYILGPVVSGAAESAFDVDSEEVEALADGVVAVVESMFGTITSQGWILTILGVGAFGLVYAEENGYIDDAREWISGDDQPQGQYQQGGYQQGQQQGGQYQQGGYQQGQQQGGQSQQGQQGQYQQQGGYQQDQQGQYQQGGQYQQQGGYQQGQQQGEQYQQGGQQDQYQQGQQGQSQQGGQQPQQDQQGQQIDGQDDGQQGGQQDDQSGGRSSETDPQQYDQGGYDDEE
jgi:hypothetical protein